MKTKIVIELMFIVFITWIIIKYSFIKRSFHAYLIKKNRKNFKINVTQRIINLGFLHLDYDLAEPKTKIKLHLLCIFFRYKLVYESLTFVITDTGGKRSSETVKV